MDDPLNPFSRKKNTAGPGSRRKRFSPSLSPLIPSANSDTLCSLILRPLTVIGFLINGGLMGGHPLVRPDFKVQVRCSDASFVFGSRFYGWLEASSFHFPPLLFPLKQCSSCTILPIGPSDSLLPSTLCQSFTSSSQRQRLFLPSSYLNLTSSSRHRGNQITSLQSTPLVDIIQQRDCDSFFLNNLVMEAAMESLTRMQYTQKSLHS